MSTTTAFRALPPAPEQSERSTRRTWISLLTIAAIVGLLVLVASLTARDPEPGSSITLDTSAVPNTVAPSTPSTIAPLPSYGAPAGTYDSTFDCKTLQMQFDQAERGGKVRRDRGDLDGARELTERMGDLDDLMRAKGCYR